MTDKKPYCAPQLIRVKSNHEQAIISVSSTWITALSIGGSSSAVNGNAH